VRALGYAVVPSLILGGLAFVVTSDALSALLALSLLLLLVWVGAVAVIAARRSADEASTAG
jgi:energy-converting hydrogenase Eha subunit C